MVDPSSIPDPSPAEVRFNVLTSVTRVLLEQPSSESLLPRLIQSICQAAGWKWGALWTLNPAGHHLQLRLATCNSESDALASFRRHALVAVGHGLPGRTWASGRPIWLANLSEDADFPRRDAALAAGLRGAIAFPVRDGNHITAVLEFLSDRAEAPDEMLLAALESIGAQIGQFLARHEAENALRRSEAINAAGMATSLDCIVTMDAAGRVVEWNPSAERVFGYARADVLGKEMATLIIPLAYQNRHREGLARYLATGKGRIIGHRIEISAMRMDGSEFPIELAITRVPLDGPAVFIGYLRDITQQKRAEAEREAALRDAEEANRAKDHFLAVLSHELRTPLTPVLALTDAMRTDETLSPARREDIHIIRRNVEIEARLIDDLLDLTRIRNGKLRLERRAVNVAELLAETAAICMPDANEKGVVLSVTCDSRISTIYGDSTRLQQAFWNLLKNAIKFTPATGRVAAHCDNPAPAELRITIADTGIGIEPDELPTIFDAFRQAERAGRQFGGLGLGLAITRAIVELHAGRIEVASPGAGRGSVFTITFPSCILPKTPAAPARPAPTAVRNRRILFVDDHIDTLRVLSRLLRGLGHQVASASSIAEALALWKPGQFDVLITDMGLPDGRGTDLLRRIHAEEKIPAIAVSGFGMDQDIQASLAVGFVVHLTKPIDVTDLQRAIDAITTSDRA